MEKENLNENLETKIEKEDALNAQVENEENEVSEVNDTENVTISNQTIIEVINITKSINKKKIIDNLSLVVEEGDIYGLLSSNSSEKTTLIKMMANLVHPDSGTIKLNDSDLKINFYKGIDKTGFVLENQKFYDYLSGYENLAMLAGTYKKLPKARIDEVLSMVKLTDNAKDKVKTYSKGMLQRLAVAAALLNNPSLVIMDEPTNGLNFKEIKELYNLIKTLADENKVTFFIASSRISDISELCNKIGVISDGQLVVNKPIKELLNSNEDFNKQELLEKSIMDIMDKGGNELV